MYSDWGYLCSSSFVSSSPSSKQLETVKKGLETKINFNDSVSAKCRRSQAETTTNIKCLKELKRKKDNYWNYFNSLCRKVQLTNMLLIKHMSSPEQLIVNAFSSSLRSQMQKKKKCELKRYLWVSQFFLNGSCDIWINSFEAETNSPSTHKKLDEISSNYDILKDLNSILWFIRGEKMFR